MNQNTHNEVLEEGEKERDILLNEIMVENFPILRREMYIQIPEASKWVRYKEVYTETHNLINQFFKLKWKDTKQQCKYYKSSISLLKLNIKESTILQYCDGIA